MIKLSEKNRRKLPQSVKRYQQNPTVDILKNEILSFLSLRSETRQGWVLSPLLFNKYTTDSSHYNTAGNKVNKRYKDLIEV